MEGFEAVAFRSKFDSWPKTASTAAPEEGRGKVAGKCFQLVIESLLHPQLMEFTIVDSSAAMLKRQGVNVKGLLKADPIKEEPQPNIDCTGDLQVSMLTSLLIEKG